MLTKYYMPRLNILATDITEWAKQKGFHDNRITDVESLCLIHTEVSEWVEAIRDGNPQSEHVPELSAREEEAADVLIRVLELCGFLNIDIAAAVAAKMKFNEGRKYRHGKVF